MGQYARDTLLLACLPVSFFFCQLWGRRHRLPCTTTVGATKYSDRGAIFKSNSTQVAARARDPHSINKHARTVGYTTAMRYGLLSSYAWLFVVCGLLLSLGVIHAEVYIFFISLAGLTLFCYLSVYFASNLKAHGHIVGSRSWPLAGVVFVERILQLVAS